MPAAMALVKRARFTSKNRLFSSGKRGIFDLTQAAEAAS
jgi:hypothetical protein